MTQNIIDKLTTVGMEIDDLLNHEHADCLGDLAAELDRIRDKLYTLSTQIKQGNRDPDAEYDAWKDDGKPRIWRGRTMPFAK